MNVLSLFRPEHGGSEHLHKLMDDIGSILSQDARIYRTYVNKTDRAYIFVTTSKDMHLLIGQLSDQGQYCLACLIEAKYKTAGDGSNEVLVHNLLTEKKYLAVVTESNRHCCIIHISPAH
jgi:hypothetical protein